MMIIVSIRDNCPFFSDQINFVKINETRRCRPLGLHQVQNQILGKQIKERSKFHSKMRIALNLIVSKFLHFCLNERGIPSPVLTLLLTINRAVFVLRYNIPVQVTPSPSKPGRHVQVKLPGELVH